MSYCRWSDEDFTCDIYCWADVAGDWVVTVAGRRVRWLVELPPDVELKADDEANTQAWVDRHMKVMEYLRDGEGTAFVREEIGLPLDGDYARFDTPGEAADHMKMLREVGYNVPEWAIDALQREQEEHSDAAH